MSWWKRLDPKQKRLILVAGAAGALALVYLLMRRRSGGEHSPKEEQEANEQSSLENTYPSAYQYGYPTGPEPGAGSGYMEPPEGFEGQPGPEGVPGSEGPGGVPGEPGPPGADAPNKVGKAKPIGGGHRDSVPNKPTYAGGSSPVPKQKKKKGAKGSPDKPTYAGGSSPVPKVGIGPGHIALPRRRSIDPGFSKVRPGPPGPRARAHPIGPTAPAVAAAHPRAVNTGNRCVNGGVGPHRAPAGYHLFCGPDGYIYRAPN